MIRLLIFSQKGLLVLFQDCLNVTIMWNLKLILLYYLAHIPSIIFLSHFWWSVPVFSMVYIWKTPAVVSPETPIQLVEILFHLSVSPTSRRILMRSTHSWTHHFLWSWGQGQYQPWGKSPLPTTGIVPRVCVRVFWVMDTMSPPLLISSISDFLMLETQWSIVRNSCSSPTLNIWNPCAVWYMSLH